MASFKAIFPVLQELFAKNHRGPFAPPPPAGRGLRFEPVPCQHWECATEHCSAEALPKRYKVTPMGLVDTLTYQCLFMH